MQKRITSTTRRSPLGARATSSIGKLKHAMKKYLFYLIPQTSFKPRFRTKFNANDAKAQKDGHFPVITVGNGKPKKFQVALAYLSHPPFVMLLKAAEAEFGFDQQGVLAVPCEASQLQNILLPADFNKYTRS